MRVAALAEGGREAGVACRAGACAHSAAREHNARSGGQSAEGRLLFREGDGRCGGGATAGGGGGVGDGYGGRGIAGRPRRGAPSLEAPQKGELLAGPASPAHCSASACKRVRLPAGDSSMNARPGEQLGSDCVICSSSPAPLSRPRFTAQSIEVVPVSTHPQCALQPTSQRASACVKRCVPRVKERRAGGRGHGDGSPRVLARR